MDDPMPSEEPVLRRLLEADLPSPPRSLLSVIAYRIETEVTGKGPLRPDGRPGDAFSLMEDALSCQITPSHDHGGMEVRLIFVEADDGLQVWYDVRTGTVCQALRGRIRKISVSNDAADRIRAAAKGLAGGR